MFKILLGNGLYLLLSLLEFIITSRYYPVEAFGKFVLFTLVLNLLCSIPNAIISQYYLRKKTKVFVNFDIVSLISAIPAAVYYLVVGDYLFCLMAIAYSVIYIRLNFYDLLLVKDSKVRELNKCYIYSSIAAVVLYVFPVYFNCTNEIFLVSILLVKNFLLLVMIRGSVKLSSLVKFRRNIFFWKNKIVELKVLALTSFISYIQSTAERWFVAVIFPVSTLAIYSRALQIVNAFIVFFNRAISKEIQSSLVNGDSGLRQKGLLILSLAFLSSFSLCFFSEEIVYYGLGEGWGEVKGILQIISFIIPLRIIQKYTDVYIRTKLTRNIYLNYYVISLVFSMSSFVFFELLDCTSVTDFTVIYLVIATFSTLSTASYVLYNTKFKSVNF